MRGSSKIMQDGEKALDKHGLKEMHIDRSADHGRRNRDLNGSRN